jgi:PDZ domain-containing protein
MSSRSTWTWRLLALGVGLGVLGLGEPPPPETGAVVETLLPGGAAEKAGLQPGDRLLHWERAARPPAARWAARGSSA